MKKGITSFDLDLTLYEHDTERITPSAMQAIKKLRENYYIVIASGRDMDSPLVTHLKKEIMPDAIIHCNGARVCVNDHVIREWLISRDVINNLIRFARERNLCVGALQDEYSYFVAEQKLVAMDFKWKGFSDRKFRPVEELLNQKVYTMTIREPEEVVKEAEQIFPELSFPRFGGLQGADIVSGDISKKRGMEELLNYWNMNFDQVIAFGDSGNDISLLQAAGKGIAMGNADEKVKQAVSIVTDDIHEDGIWNACKRLELF